MQVYLGLDVGKTKMRLGIFNTDLVLMERSSFPTADVKFALQSLTQLLLELSTWYEIQATGISIFGPLQVDPNKEDYGAIVESSEVAWSGVNIPRLVAKLIERDVYFDFDVNAVALAEANLGSGKGKSSFVYLSVGTGIGAVYFHNTHRPGFAPQIGHTYIPREPDDLGFEGSCRFHGICLQGLASGKALAERWGMPAERLGENHPAWDLEARYLARACTNLIYTFSPRTIVLGSSVGSVPHLVSLTTGYLPSMLKNFLDPDLLSLYHQDSPVVQAMLGPESSLVGAAILGAQQSGLLVQ